MKLVIASNNKHKIREIREILGNFFEVAYSLSDLGIDTEIIEDGATFFENALIKAKAISEMTNMVALADDSGLVVDALGGAPGVYSARYSGEGHTDEKNIDFLLNNLNGIIQRKAHFACCIVLHFPDGTYLSAEGKTDGEILPKREGEGGFGYDPVFFSYDLNKSFGIASSEEKNAVSHRGRALRSLQAMLNEKNAIFNK
ncbi:XTP/dITP diphosphatase [bacterium]|nr:XTP/dITP diphosphatase [bacterium]